MTYINDWLKIHAKRDYQEVIANKEQMHINSKETIQFMKDNGLFDDVESVFEVGCGSGRNLDYMLKIKPSLEIGANDLIRKACFAHMADAVKSKIKFKEQETGEMFEQEVPDCDLLFAHDHIMHLDRETVSKMLDRISEDPKPKYILIREPKIERIDHKPIRLVHNFSKLTEKYDIASEMDCESDSAYYLRLYRRKTE